MHLSSRFIVGSNRAIFMLRDGGYAWEIKDFLISQERCADVTLEGQVYPGKGADGSEKGRNKTKPEKAKKKKDAEKVKFPFKEQQSAIQSGSCICHRSSLCLVARLSSWLLLDFSASVFFILSPTWLFLHLTLFILPC